MTYGEGKVPAYAVHTEAEIKGFFGPARFLSNFWPATVYFDGLWYPSSECAFQAAKVIPNDREPFTKMTPAEAKEAWKLDEFTKIYQSAEWDTVRYDVMLAIVFDKFYRNVDLRRKLLLTGKAYLEEKNSWGDTYWGVDIRKGGCNNLGQILTIVRSVWNISPNNLPL